MKLDLRMFAMLGIDSRLKELNAEIDLLNEIKQELIKNTLKNEPAKAKVKPHWTQTTAGKKKMSKLIKQAWAKKKATNGNKNNQD